MKYLLDTNMCIYIIKKKSEQVIRKLMRQNIAQVGISSITLSELEYGVEKSSHKERNRLALGEFLAPINILPYDDGAALAYGKIMAVLENEGIVIGPLDMLIGAHAISLKLTLVTNNHREFERMPGLEVENWCV
jgi:tRNA(fMet)-specific endonuclease VapC